MLRCDPRRYKKNLSKRKIELIVKMPSMITGVRKMKNGMIKKCVSFSLFFILFVSVSNLTAVMTEITEDSSLHSLLPKVNNWKFSEEPQTCMSTSTELQRSILRMISKN
jgi:hypothetical protein